MSERRIIPVSRLVSYVRSYLENDPVLTGVLVEGEISNLRQPYSGHWYFSLKDSQCSINCVMFASSNRSVRFPVRNGLKVVVRGNVSVYPAQGALQLVVNAMRESGIGDLYQQLEVLKRKLSAEGLFDEAHKKPLPPYPMDIALVTGNDTAARKDVLVTLANRWPCAKVSEYPCPVQGTDAPPKIIAALKSADAHHHDVVLLVRGGGSIEELWCFNNEDLGRAIYDMDTPVITGIGHEIDFTIADFCADVRANTPTGAAKDATPDINEVKQAVNNRMIRMHAVVNRRLGYERQRCERAASHPVIAYPERMITDREMQVDYLRERLMKTADCTKDARSACSDLAARLRHEMNTCAKDLHTRIVEDEMRMNHALSRQTQNNAVKLDAYNDRLARAVTHTHDTERNRLARDSALLDAYSPLKILSRGYSIVTKDHETLRSVKSADSGDEIEIRLSDGLLSAEITGKEVNDEHREERNDI